MPLVFVHGVNTRYEPNPAPQDIRTRDGLFRQYSLPRWSLAEHWLTETVRRGVPLYTQGLRLLHDGLRVLVARGAAVEEPFERVRAIAASANWTSGVTHLVSTDPRELPERSALAVGGRR